MKITTQTKWPTSDSGDAVGVWDEKDILAAMADLKIPNSSKNTWIDWVLDHAFDCELDSKIQDLFVENDDVLMIKVRVNGTVYTIEKKG